MSPLGPRGPALALGVVVVAAAVGALPFLDLPLIEDDKFWWVPKAMVAMERGFPLVPAGELPEALVAGAAGPPPPQWSGGLPDYGHPPLFFWYLAAWMGLSGAGVKAVHVALIPLTAAALVGTARLARAVGATGWAPAGAAAMLLAWPVFFAQGLRADLDLGLIAVVPWALAAAVERRWLAYALLSWLAVWIKEPGVLVGAAAGGMWLATSGPILAREGIRGLGRQGWAALVATVQPLVALGAWAAIHRAQVGWALASPERLPDGGAGWAADALVAGRWLLFEQGRWLAVGLIAVGWLIARARPAGELARRQGALAAYVIVVGLFFSIVGFFGASAGRPGGATHLRYFLPALPALAALAVVSAQALAPRWALGGVAAAVALGLVDLRGAPWGGPERNLFGADLARARQQMAPHLRAHLDRGRRVWVGQAEIPDVQFPAVGGVGEGIPGLTRYGPESAPEDLAEGDLVMVSAYGEPPARLQDRLAASEVVVEILRGRAWVRLIKVR